MNGRPQLPLEVRIRRPMTFATYLSDRNEELAATLKRYATAQAVGPLYFWGTPGSGKSHLLHAGCDWSSTNRFLAVYLDLQQTDYIEPHWNGITLLALDNIGAVCGDAERELQLFNAINSLDLKASALVLAANQRVTDLPLTLPDLRSRLALAPQFRITELADERKGTWLQAYAQSHGLEISTATVEYVLNHTRRDLKYLAQLIDQLDLAALSGQRAITIPLVKSVLNRYPDRACD